MNAAPQHCRVLIQSRDLALVEELQRILRQNDLRAEALSPHGGISNEAAAVVLVDLRGARRPGARLHNVQQRVPSAALVAVVAAGHDLRIEDARLARAVVSTLRPPLHAPALLSVVDAASRLAGRRSHQRLRALAPSGCVLLIEDDEDHAALTRLYMQRVAPSQTMRWVRDVGSALETLRDQDVKLVLTDLSLPDGQGLDVIRRLRTSSPSVPIVVVSALLDDALSLEALRAGAEDCLAKDGLNTRQLRRALEFAAERGERMGELAERAQSDALTRLCNHGAFEQRLEQALSRARRLQSKLAVVFLDLDGFKQVNDRLGHLSGDRLLCEMAQRLRRLVRQQDVVARFGGDEFALLVEDVEDHAGITRLAERALAVLQRPVPVGGELLRPRCSMGIAVFPEHGEGIDELVHASDAAMYEAKRAGGGRYVLHDERPLSRRRRRAEALSGTVLRRSLGVCFQPQISLQDGRVAGVEALLRGREPGGGTVAAREAVSLLERAGLMVDTGRWMLATALSQMPALRCAAGNRLTLAVNLSPCELAERHLLRHVEAALRAHQLSPDALEVDVTDLGSLREPKLRDQLRGLRSLGARVALQGVGRADALHALCELTCDTLKLDPQFVRAIGADERAQVVARHVVELSHELGLRVVAVGVETPGQLAALRHVGCDHGQGHLFGAPAPAWQEHWTRPTLASSA